MGPLSRSQTEGAARYPEGWGLPTAMLWMNTVCAPHNLGGGSRGSKGMVDLALRPNKSKSLPSVICTGRYRYREKYRIWVGKTREKEMS